MNNSRSLLCVCFCAGLLGALFNSLVAWFLGTIGLTQMCGVDLAPAWTTAWLYPRMVWGGLWGMAYFLTVGSPRSRNQWVRKGLWTSLLPSAYQLFYIFPNKTAFGILGLGLGTLTPIFVIFYNLAWGAVTGISARALWGRNR